MEVAVTEHTRRSGRGARQVPQEGIQDLRLTRPEREIPEALDVVLAEEPELEQEPVLVERDGRRGMIRR